MSLSAVIGGLGPSATSQLAAEALPQFAAGGMDLEGLGPILAGLGSAFGGGGDVPQRITSLGNPNIKAGTGGIIPTQLPQVNPASVNLRRG